MYINLKEKVFPFIKELGGSKDTAFSKYMKDAIFLIPTPKSLTKVIDGIADLDLNNKDINGN